MIILAIVSMFLLSHWLVIERGPLIGPNANQWKSRTTEGRSSIGHNLNQWEQKQVYFLSISKGFGQLICRISRRRTSTSLLLNVKTTAKVSCNHWIIWFFDFWEWNFKFWIIWFFDSCEEYFLLLDSFNPFSKIWKLYITLANHISVDSWWIFNI